MLPFRLLSLRTNCTKKQQTRRHQRFRSLHGIPHRLIDCVTLAFVCLVTDCIYIHKGDVEEICFFFLPFLRCPTVGSRLFCLWYSSLSEISTNSIPVTCKSGLVHTRPRLLFRCGFATDSIKLGPGGKSNMLTTGRTSLFRCIPF